MRNFDYNYPDDYDQPDQEPKKVSNKCECDVEYGSCPGRAACPYSTIDDEIENNQGENDD